MKPWLGALVVGGSVLVLGGTFLVAIPSEQNIKRQGNYIFTFYTFPRPLLLGNIQMAVRVQDRDYHILDLLKGTFTVVNLRTQARQKYEAHPGPGRDLRSWLTLRQPGDYRVEFTFAAPEGNTLTASYQMRIPVKSTDH